MTTEEFQKVLLEQVVRITQELTEVKDQMVTKDNIKVLENRLINIELKLENSIEPKIQVLFDTDKQKSDQLNRIETEVTKHDKFILERIK